MKDEITTFETSELAKKKRFDWVGKAYHSDGSFQNREILTNYNHKFFIDGDNYLITAPTQSLLNKWLREIHGYYVIIIPTITSNWTFKILNILKKDTMEVPPYKNVSGEDFSTFEDALEKGLQEILKAIK
jgi:hypothetical protein